MSETILIPNNLGGIGKKLLASKKRISFLVLLLIVIFILIGLSNLVYTVRRGSYAIVQYPFTGTLEAWLDPGMKLRWFGTVQSWPYSQTFYFTQDPHEGKAFDQSIWVQFNDGSRSQISGTCRIDLSHNQKFAIELMSIHNFKDFDDLDARLILPTIRRALNLTANLMSARESYAEKKADFFRWAWDQIENGPFVTEEKTIVVKDEKSGDYTTKSIRVVQKDEKGFPKRERNPLENTGITLSNFEIKEMVYDDIVKQQIADQQRNFMAIATARAQAEKAEQDAKTIKVQGEAKVMEVRYKELQVREQATIQAERDKAVAIIEAGKKVEVEQKAKEQALIAANRELEVANLTRQAAEQHKQRLILEGQGEAEKRKLILAADGALAQKLDAWIKAQQQWATAYSQRKVPSIIMGGGKEGAPDHTSFDFMNLLTIWAAKQLSLDMTVPGGTDQKK